ncbi:hypothetical protein TL16_g05542 [Triparma laevis f. inornata]|uniref:Uncharacterized protein n=1 Tax=Triparma laevis f. inornata TaxID=1714386 RepID=A0A9W7EA02_9STRA|nr:hypothetical protein TL16_g05542 [Triparma laevis f. inornata]
MTQVVSISRYIRAVLFIPIFVLSALWLAMVFSGDHDLDENYGWLAYQWNGFAISSTIVIWTSKVRKPYMVLEILTFLYWPLMVICIDIERNSAFGKDWLLIPRLLVLSASFALAVTIRQSLAKLQDRVLSAHLQKVIWGGGESEECEDEARSEEKSDELRIRQLRATRLRRRHEHNEDALRKRRSY